MSTILDALRKVQSERRPRDLRESVLRGESGVAGAVPGPRGLWVALAILLMLALPAAGAWFVWPGGEQLLAALPELPPWADADADAARQPAQAAQAQQPTPREVREAREARRVDRKAIQAAAAQRRESRSKVGRQLEAVAREPAGAPAQNLPRAPVAEAARPPAPTPPRPLPAPTRAVASTRPAPPPLVAEPEPREPRPEIDLSVHLEPLPAAELERIDSGDPFATGSVHEVAFPDLSVEAVRWHPEPERRVARILLDGTRPIEAREGDIIAGVAIQRIDPGAVEMRMGEMRTRLKPGQ